MKAKDVMTAAVITVSSDHSVMHAARIMLDQRISGLPVVNNDGDLVGILSEGDLMRRSELGAEALAALPRQSPARHDSAGAYVKSHSWKVGDVMTAAPVTANEETSLSSIAALMVERGIKRIPIVRGEKLVGVVSRADLLRALVACQSHLAVVGDDAIRRSILTRLREDVGMSGVGLVVTVSHGLVHLAGVVNSQDERDAVRVAAESIRGVIGVQDDLSIA